MLINKAYKFRIYPTPEQAILINKTIGCSRFVFNRFLAQWKDSFEKMAKGLTYSVCSAELTNHLSRISPMRIHDFSKSRMMCLVLKARKIRCNPTPRKFKGKASVRT